MSRADFRPYEMLALEFWLVQGLEVGDDRFALTLEKRWKDDLFAERCGILVDSESGAVGGNLEKDVTGLPEIQTPEIVAVDFTAVRNAE